MSDANAQVSAMVERALKKNPDLKSTELKDRASKINADMEKLSGRQFHAQYVIQVRRKLFGSRPKKREGTKAAQRHSRGATDAGASFLAAAFREKKQELDAALDDAFQRALATDSVRQIDELLASIKRQTRELERV